MGAWGYKALESDSALDMVGQINDDIIRRLRRDLKTKRFSQSRGKRVSRNDHLSARVVASHVIRMYKSKMAPPEDLFDIALDTIKALEKVRGMTDDLYEYYSYSVNGNIKSEDVVEFKKNTKKDINNQIRMLKKITEHQ